MLPPETSRPSWATISLTQLAHNYRVLQDLVPADVSLMTVVKANAYGHGAAQCAQVLQAAGAAWFGVALVEEAIELRTAGIVRPICCLGGCWPAQAELVENFDLTPALFRLDVAQALNAQARAARRRLPVHLKVDTGMGRYGVPLAELPDFLAALRRCEWLLVDGLMTHFADADNADDTYTTKQIAAYATALQLMAEVGHTPQWKHLANSAGLHGHPAAHGNLVRAGAALYGLTADVLRPDLPRPMVQPVLSWHSRIALLKTVPAGTALGYGCSFTTKRASRIATIPLGYADGLRRALSNQGTVIVRGQLAPIVGRVSMDLTLVDVTAIAAVALDDEVTLIGEQQGVRLTAEQVAAQCGTISYEIVTGISARVPRHFSAPPND